MGKTFVKHVKRLIVITDGVKDLQKPHESSPESFSES